MDFEDIGETDKIVVFVEIKDFEDDLDVLAMLTDFRLNDDPKTIRLTYGYRPRAGLDGDPSSPPKYLSVRQKLPENDKQITWREPGPRFPHRRSCRSRPSRRGERPS